MPNLTIFFIIILLSPLLNGCAYIPWFIPGHGFSESMYNKAAGENLSFESIKKGFPVNWYFKTERVINNMSKEGDIVDFDLIIDSTDVKDGKYSLKYIVRKCNSTNEYMRLYEYYPGFFKYIVIPTGTKYRVSFWIKNNGCEFEILSGAVNSRDKPFKCENNKLILKENISEWKKYSITQNVCTGMDELQIDVSVKSVGTFQIDGFIIEILDKM